jgi:RNA polymerase sigma-70 factor (ECF subfamily)
LESVNLDDLSFPETEGTVPEEVYDREWAGTLAERALTKVRTDYTNSGREKLFDALRSAVWGGHLVPLSDIALQLGISVSAVKVAVHRLRERLRAALRAEVAETVTQAGSVEEELRYLISVLSRSDSL